MPGPRHDPPLHQQFFAVPRAAGRRAEGVVARVPGDPASGFDVLDEHGEAIGLFAVDGDVLTLHAPHGLDATGAVTAERITLEQHGRPVLDAVPDGDTIRVQVPDPRLDVRLARALVLTLDEMRNL